MSISISGNAVKIKQNGEYVELPFMKGDPGDSYEITAEDYAEIARIAADNYISDNIAPFVDDWLDEHPEATTTVDFSVVSKVFATVAAMISDTTLSAGDNVCTKGYYASGDGGADNFVVAAAHIGIFYITLANGLYANRLEEGTKVSADKIGIKHYTTRALAEADTSGMSSNHTIAQSALTNGKTLIFGEGFYAFDNYLQMASQAGSIYGSKRQLSRLCFPNGIGINFNVDREYDYVNIDNLQIYAYGNCINVTADVRNVVDSKFTNLTLRSETGSGFVAPPLNRGSRSGDTCVWSCVFSNINGFCTNGAIAENVTGLGNWFYYTNQCGDTKIAYKNCTGVFARFDTLTSDAQYAFYFDNVADYALRLTLIDFHFERMSKSFIYFTDEAAATSAIGVFAIDSGASNLNLSNHDIPFIRVGRLFEYIHYGKYTILPNESMYDMSAINGALIHVRGTEAVYTNSLKTNLGGEDGLKIYAETSGATYRFYKSGSNTVYRYAGNADYEIREAFHAMGIDNIYGGRMHQVLNVSENMLPSGAAKYLILVNLDNTKLFCDSMNFTVTTDNIKIRSIRTNEQESDVPGRILTITNDTTSTKNVVLEKQSGSTYQGFVSENDITIEPGGIVHLMLSFYYVNGNRYPEWFPFTLSYNPT